MLHTDAVSNKESMVRWRSIQKEFQKINKHTRGYTTVSPSTISEYILMNEDERLLFDLNTVDEMRKRLREVVQKQIALYIRK